MVGDKQPMDSPLDYESDFIRPLHEVVNEFLQVLVTEFNLRSNGHGIDLNVSFNDKSPAIWMKQAKIYLQQHIPIEKRSFYQSEFEKLLTLGGNNNYFYSDSSFPFRFGNGGTLPVVRVGQTDYYCLFFRNTHPMGWNIANGGANNLYDLLHPDAIIERELREELIIFEPKKGRRYVFDWHNARIKYHSDFELANHLWMERFRRQNFPEIIEVPLPLKWMPPYDMDTDPDFAHACDSIFVSFGNDLPVYTGYGFLNINGEDFGIEFDRIAKLAVGPDAVFCDGEIVQGKLLNRVIGLFETQKLNALLSDENEFFPDRLFWNGQERTGDQPIPVIKEYLRSSNGKRNITETANDIKLELCPVTRNIITRYLRMTNSPKTTSLNVENNRFDIFISFASEARKLAEKVYDTLRRNENNKVFFSDVMKYYGPFSEQIDHALDTSQALVAVGNSLEDLYKSWVKYEWRSFHNDILSGRKPDNTPFIAFVPNVNPHDLPRPFRERNITLKLNETTEDEALIQLSRSLDMRILEYLSRESGNISSSA